MVQKEGDKMIDKKSCFDGTGKIWRLETKEGNVYRVIADRFSTSPHDTSVMFYIQGILVGIVNNYASIIEDEKLITKS